jgi:hypothetical protein
MAGDVLQRVRGVEHVAGGRELLVDGVVDAGQEHVLRRQLVPVGGGGGDRHERLGGGAPGLEGVFGEGEHVGRGHGGHHRGQRELGRVAGGVAVDPQRGVPALARPEHHHAVGVRGDRQLRGLREADGRAQGVEARDRGRLPDDVGVEVLGREPRLVRPR